MSSLIDENYDNTWCIDTDGLSFGPRQTNEYYDLSYITSFKDESLPKYDDSRFSDYKPRHSYVNLKYNEGILSHEVPECQNLILKNITHDMEITKQPIKSQEPNVNRNSKRKVRIGIMIGV